MANAAIQTSGDWAGDARSRLLAWWIPQFAMLAGLLTPTPPREAIWTIALIWMGAACILNARKVTMAALVVGFQCFPGYGYNASAAATDSQGTQEVPWPTKSWQVSTPEEQGMDSASLARLIETVGAYKQDSLMIIRHGKVVAEAYYAPYVAGVSHDLRSVTKSVVGTLTAIELKKGDLDSVDHPVMDLFADEQVQNIDDRKRAGSEPPGHDVWHRVGGGGVHARRDDIADAQES